RVGVEPFVEGKVLGTVRWLHRETLYGVVGDVPWYLVGLFALVSCWTGPSAWRVSMWFRGRGKQTE
ncbi:MAG: hypothetical protein FWD57_17275, partial [Polyangiaceae bacterium]|nr:hypothetical protein [Polyangiaceae bacterium]